MSSELTGDQMWKVLLEGQYGWDKERRLYGLLPGKHRCKNCKAPQDGIGSWIARLTGRGKFRRNPRFCNF